SFSFTTHDFGPCFLLRNINSHPVEKILQITNKDKQEISLECLYKSTPHLEVYSSPTVLQEGRSIDIPIHFMPRNETKYKEIIPFDINGLQVVNVEVAGEGIKIKVELENEEQQNLNLGAIRVGQKVTHTVNLINRSKKTAKMTLISSRKKLASYA